MTLNWEELSNPLKTETPCRETLTSYRAGQSQAIGSLTSASAGFCRMDKAFLDVWPDWAQTLESSHTERNLGILVNGKLNMGQQYPGSQGSQPCPGGHREQQNQPGEGGEFLTNTSKSKPRTYKFLFALKIFPCSYINSTFPYYDCAVLLHMD